MLGKNEVILKIEGLNKSFTATKAVVDLSMEIFKGEIRGLIGENGSGKSTLASMISGWRKQDSGRMQKDGQDYTPTSSLDGRTKGVSILVQEMGTIKDLTVADNIFLGKESLFSRNGFVNRKAMEDEAKIILAEIDASYIDPSKKIDEFSFEDRKLVEVATALHDKPDILILDETTTALSQKGREKIYSIINKMKKEGKTAIFISHDLSELEEVCDNISVLRDGCLIETLPKEEITIERMRQLMIGRDLSGHYYRDDMNGSSKEETVLKIENISLNPILKDVSFDLYKGEILGIGGLTECGMHELCKVMFGVTKPDKGTITALPKNKTIKKATDSIANKVAFVPKNREEEAMMASASIKDNIMLMSYDKIKKGPFISKKDERQLTRTQTELLQVKMTSINQACVALSGGNKQKVVIAKWLANDSEIFILDCPTRGIDVGVKAAIYSLMEDLVKQGKSMIMVSEELPELLGMSDRIIILKDGEISGEFDRDVDLNESKIIQKMI